MNRTINLNTAPRHTLRPTFGDWMALLFACLRCLFAHREVRIGTRVFFGGTAFLMMLGVGGAIECGSMAMLPGGLLCLGLMVVSFLILRGLTEEV